MRRVAEQWAEQGKAVEAARIWYRLGKIYDRQGVPEKSDAALLKALELATTAGSDKARAVITNYLAGNYSERGRVDSAIALYRTSYRLFLEQGDTVSAASIALNLGGEFVNRGEYEQALNAELDALRLKELSGDSSDLAYFYQQIGEVYKVLGIREKWKEYLSRARELSAVDRYASPLTRIAILNDAAALMSVNDTDSALALYQQMYRLSRKHDYRKGMYTALSNMSTLWRKRGDPGRAASMAEEAYRLADEEHQVYNLVAQSNHLGDLYLAMGEPGKASAWYRKAMIMAGDKYPDEMKRSLHGLYRANKKAGRMKDALTYLERYILLRDSLEDVAVKNKVQELETIYQTEKKIGQIRDLSQRNLLQRQQLRTQRILLWSILLLLLFSGVIIFVVIRHARLKARNREIMLEQRLLRSQMNPHFIFNSLGAIQNFMYHHETRKAAFYLSKFSSLMRAILEHSREEVITLEEEIRFLRDYLELQSMRLGFRYQVGWNGETDEREVLIPPMLVQPFVENAIEHGIRSMGEQGEVKVTFETGRDHLTVIVEDNGTGIAAGDTSREEHRSLALTIFRERIELLASSMKRKIVYKILDKNENGRKEKGTKVIIELPLTKD